MEGGSTAINLDGAVNGRAFNNLIHGNGKGGFVLWQGNGNSSANNNVFFNTSVYNPAGARVAFLLYTGASGNVIFNNILYSRSGGLAAEGAGSGNQHDHNLASSFEDVTMSAGESSPDGAMLFANAAGSDFHLGAGSAAVDRGVPSFAGKSAGPGDLEGRQRPAGTAFDLGCYELGGPPGVVEPAPVEGVGGVDAGAIRDAGGPGGTGGSGGSRDAGAPGPGVDAGGRGGGGSDAAGPGPGSSDGGCGCRVGEAPAEGGGALLLIALASLLGLSARRRRR
jgi:MYXO-CTERM domain-containing protein